MRSNNDYRATDLLNRLPVDVRNEAVAKLKNGEPLSKAAPSGIDQTLWAQLAALGVDALRDAAQRIFLPRPTQLNPALVHQRDTLRSQLANAAVNGLNLGEDAGRIQAYGVEAHVGGEIIGVMVAFDPVRNVASIRASTGLELDVAQMMSDLALTDFRIPNDRHSYRFDGKYLAIKSDGHPDWTVLPMPMDLLASDAFGQLRDQHPGVLFGGAPGSIELEQGAQIAPGAMIATHHGGKSNVGGDVKIESPALVSNSSLLGATVLLADSSFTQVLDSTLIDAKVASGVNRSTIERSTVISTFVEDAKITDSNIRIGGFGALLHARLVRVKEDLPNDFVITKSGAHEGRFSRKKSEMIHGPKSGSDFLTVDQVGAKFGADTSVRPDIVGRHYTEQSPTHKLTQVMATDEAGRAFIAVDRFGKAGYVYVPPDSPFSHL